MEKHKLKGFLFALVIIFNSCIPFISGCSEKEEFVPVLRFSVASDVHIEDDNSSILEEERLVALFDKAYSYSMSKKSNVSVPSAST